MAGCVLRAWDDGFQPETFLHGSSLEPCNIFRKGARRSESSTWDTSGITVVVSEASDDFAKQVVDAIEFLKAKRTELLWLQGSAGLEGMSLDFGVNRRNGFLQSHAFPPELARLAGELSMALELSIYGTALNAPATRRTSRWSALEAGGRKPMRYEELKCSVSLAAHGSNIDDELCR